MSAQTTVFPRKMMVHSLEGVVCSGELRVHNPKPRKIVIQLRNLGCSHRGFSGVC